MTEPKSEAKPELKPARTQELTVDVDAAQNWADC